MATKIRKEEWLSQKLDFAMTTLNESIEIDPDIRGGIPVVRGTRIPVARILAEVAADSRLSEIAEDFSIDRDTLKNLIDGIATKIDRPMAT
jgi:uncharacterized protein (DUF433 family)